ncbi:conserved hypothetical protein [Hahella chejuensis KCTC 2396]|uniref:MoxR-vWA-beta-propeller ternary system domain-containing protein n=1 Tax=Hahella chejuensis (strain KCTC 2396) TaxID=349521 RepID=Q2SIG2_HAHCH|nr:bpX6 domain-containing protein [Hahella chejuensis]ABC29562.1 conserved hypothetical protein [Hahella chejuensis KCTC 2396]
MKAKKLLHQGVLDCQGLLLEPGSGNANLDGLKRQILENWIPGAFLYELDGCWALVWPQPRELNCQQISAYALVRYGDTLSTTPLQEGQFTANAPLQWLLRQHAGDLARLSLHKEKLRAPSEFIAINRYRVLTVEPLGEINPPEVAIQHVDSNVRQVFKGAGLQASQAQQETLEALKQSQSGASSGPTLSGLVRAALSGLFGQSGGNRPATASGPSRPSGSPWSRMRDAVSMYLMTTRMGAFLGRKQAQHLHKMMELFEQGLLEEALKNAIPLQDIRDAFERGPGRPAFGAPDSRQSLSLSTQRQNSGGSVYVQDESMSLLERTYEQAFKRLDAAGKVEEAAFVLADLLRKYERAVDYLEKHGRFKLAAELAEGQQLFPARVVRQWLLAGDIERAIAIVRQTGCHKNVLDLLQRHAPEEADRMRWEFASLQAAEGDFHAAVTLAWPLEDKRAEVIDWISKAVSEGGDNAAKLLVYYLKSGHPANAQTYLTEVLRILSTDQAEYVNVRYTLIQELSTSSGADAKQEAVRLAARTAVRALLNELSAGHAQYDKRLLQRLLGVAADPLLSHEITALSLGAAGRSQGEALYTRVQPLEYGLTKGAGAAILDICPLHNGGFLIARGDAGLFMHNALGQCIHSWSVGARALVGSDHGNRALVLDRNESFIKAQYFDLAGRSVRRWLELKADRIADSFDGGQWIAAEGVSLWSLDVLNPQRTALWSISDLPGQVVALNRTPRSLTLLVQSSEDAFELWRYRLPHFFLRARDPISKTMIRQCRPLAMGSDGVIAGIFKDPRDTGVEYLSLIEGDHRGDPLALPPTDKIAHVLLEDDWLAVATQSPGGGRKFRLYARQGRLIRQLCLSINVEGFAPVRAKFFPGRLALYSDDGKVMVIELAEGRLVADWSL